MDFAAEWDIEGTAQFLCRPFRRVALQFPDEHLSLCKAVTEAVKGRCTELGHDVQARLHSLAWTRPRMRVAAPCVATWVRQSCLHLWTVADLCSRLSSAGVCAGRHILQQLRSGRGCGGAC